MIRKQAAKLMAIDDLHILVSEKIMTDDMPDAERAFWMRMVNVYADANGQDHRWDRMWVSDGRASTTDGSVSDWRTDGVVTQERVWRDASYEWRWEDIDTPIYTL